MEGWAISRTQQKSEPVGIDPIILTPLLRWVASDPWGARFSLEEIAETDSDPLWPDLARLLESVDSETLSRERSDPHFTFLYGSRPEAAQEQFARLQVVARAIQQAADELRVALLRTASREPRPSPYDHPALQDVTVDEDNLVALAEFEIDGLALSRNGHTFSMVPPVDSQNSAYWLLQTIAHRRLADGISVRLDPLMHRPASEFSRVGYKMWLYGRHLELAALSRMTEEQFGRWIPGKLSSRCAFTDYVWSPRERELHLILEELPTLEQIGTRGPLPPRHIRARERRLRTPRWCMPLLHAGSMEAAQRGSRAKGRKGWR
jgi:hypothetical protein